MTKKRSPSKAPSPEGPTEHAPADGGRARRRSPWRDVLSAGRDTFRMTRGFPRGRLDPDPVRDLNRAERFLAANLRVIFLVFRLEVYKRVELHAQALTMKSLLSLVPLLVVTFAILSAFSGGLQDANREIIQTVLGYLSGSADLQRAVSEYVAGANVQEAELGSFTIVILIVTVMSLLNHVESTFNTLFGVTTQRPAGVRLLAYWALLTLGPLLLLSSIALTAALGAGVEGLAGIGGIAEVAIEVAPLSITWLAFALLYLMVPNTHVRVVPAVLAAMVAGSLWNLAKYGFAWYARTNVTIHDIYGSLAAFPLFILWVYISWVLILGGAQLCFAFQHAATYRRHGVGEPASHAGLERATVRLALAVARDHLAGRPPPAVADLAAALGIPGDLAEPIAEHLRSGGFVIDTAGGGLVPARDPAAVTVADLLTHMRERVGKPPDLTRHPNGELTDPILDQAAREGRRVAEVSLRDLAEQANERESVLHPSAGT